MSDGPKNATAMLSVAAAIVLLPLISHSAAAEKISTATGFFVSAHGHVITNAHVVAGCKRINIRSHDRSVIRADLIASDRTNDLALLRAGSKNTKFAQLNANHRVGQRIFAFGFPLSGLLSSTGNFTPGAVTSLTGLLDDVRMLQISNPIQPGNSGGPVFDRYGNVVAVVVGKLNSLRVAQAIKDIPQNVNFAIKSDLVQLFLDTHLPGSASRTQRSKIMEATEIAAAARRISVAIRCARPDEVATGAPNPRADTVASVRRRLLKFIRYEYLLEGQSSGRMNYDIFAASVDYFSKGPISKSELIADKERYFNRWPARVYSVERNSVKVWRTGSSLVSVYFQYSFLVANRGRATSIRGLAWTQLNVDTSSGAFKIVLEKGGVIRRY